MLSFRTPRTRRISLDAALALAFCAALNSACAMSRMGEAEVVEKDGQPCFALTAKEASRGPHVRVHAVAVSDESSKPVMDVWRASLDPARTPLSASACIAYGQADGDAIKPASLKTGRVYQVYLNGRSSDPGDSTQGYIAKFCLMPGPGAGAIEGGEAKEARKLVPVKPGMPAWRSGVCQ